MYKINPSLFKRKLTPIEVVDEMDEITYFSSTFRTTLKLMQQENVAILSCYSNHIDTENQKVYTVVSGHITRREEPVYVFEVSISDVSSGAGDGFTPVLLETFQGDPPKSSLVYKIKDLPCVVDSAEIFKEDVMKEFNLEFLKRWKKSEYTGLRRISSCGGNVDVYKNESRRFTFTRKRTGIPQHVQLPQPPSAMTPSSAAAAE